MWGRDAVGPNPTSGVRTAHAHDGAGVYSLGFAL